MSPGRQKRVRLAQQEARGPCLVVFSGLKGSRPWEQCEPGERGLSRKIWATYGCHVTRGQEDQQDSPS